MQHRDREEAADLQIWNYSEMLGKEKKYLEEMIKVDAVEGFPEKVAPEENTGGSPCRYAVRPGNAEQEEQRPELPIMKNNDHLRNGLGIINHRVCGIQDRAYRGQVQVCNLSDSGRHRRRIHSIIIIGQDYESSYLHLVADRSLKTSYWGLWKMAAS